MSGNGKATAEITEAEFLGQVIALAELLGYHAAHFRPALTSRGWRTPVQGSLGKGFPDLVLVSARRRRVVFAELKRDKAHLSDEQVTVLEVLRLAGAEVHVWRPKDWDEIAAILGT
jgi:hypothetical protein